ncbi:MAG: hypothetical protein KC442_01155 [Thermomicrobiales bacterium]|nr:hypothetical protein [Thermomicrobiales bacterium]
MNTLKQGLAAVTLVTSLGLASVATFAGPAAADLSTEAINNPQPMTITCDLDGSSANGFEYESTVNSVDKGNALGPMWDAANRLRFVAVSGTVYTIWTAIEDNTLFAQDDSSPFARRPLDAGDLRLAGGYPVTFDTPPGYPYATFGDGFTTNATKKKGKKRGRLVDCVVTDVGNMTRAEAKAEMGSTQCLRDGVLQDMCYQNFWWNGASAEDVQNSRPCLASGNAQYDKCMALGVTYHYEDRYEFKALVTNGKHKRQHKHRHK